MLFIYSLSNSQGLPCSPDDNERVRILNADIPNSYTCYMEMTRGNSIRYGTGFLIHPRVLVSAGHNFAWYPSGTVSQVKVYFGSIDSVTYLVGDTINLIRSNNKFYQSNYWINGKINNDYSIIILPDSSIYKKTNGYFKILNPTDTGKINSINITGSPGDQPLFQMWTSSTKNYKFKGDYLVYDLHTEVRNSGSPIWTKIDSNYYVLGVHSRQFGQCNAALILNEKILNNIKNWCKSAGIIL